MTTRYRLIIDGPSATCDPADLADALAHSAEGRVISTTEHPDGVLALIDVPDQTAADYLETLLDEDARVTSYGVAS